MAGKPFRFQIRIIEEDVFPRKIQIYRLKGRRRVPELIEEIEIPAELRYQRRYSRVMEALWRWLRAMGAERAYDEIIASRQTIRSMISEIKDIIRREMAEIKKIKAEAGKRIIPALIEMEELRSGMKIAKETLADIAGIAIGWGLYLAYEFADNKSFALAFIEGYLRQTKNYWDNYGTNYQISNYLEDMKIPENVRKTIRALLSVTPILMAASRETIERAYEVARNVLRGAGVPMERVRGVERSEEGAGDVIKVDGEEYYICLLDYKC